jgi:MFS transporter, UMF1 family
LRQSAAGGTGSTVSALAVVSWAAYDFANTIFSISILSYFFPLWLGDELGGGADLFNYITAASMLLVVATAPFFGAVGDLRQRRKPFLVAFTLAAVGCTLLLDAFGTVAAAVALFVAANFAFQSALIFYNSLLPAVASGRDMGRISGYGTAAGYVGAIAALVLLTYLVTEPEAVRSALGPLGWWISTGDEPNSNAFVPTAVLYLIFALPAFLFVPDRRVREPRPVGLRTGYRNVVRTLRNIRRYPGMGLFMLATLLYTDTANTVVANMSLYGRVVFDMSQGEIRNLLLFSTVFAAAGAIGSGFLTDRLGPKRSLILVVVLWLAAVGFATAATEAWMLLAVGPLVGVALGATWVVSRVMLVSLSPPDQVGEFFGFYALAGRVSAVTGPALAGVILTVFDGLGEGAYRLAVLSLAVTLTVALLLLLRVPDVRPERLPELATGHISGDT